MNTKHKELWLQSERETEAYIELFGKPTAVESKDSVLIKL